MEQIMNRNANLKWQECIDLGYRQDSRSNSVEATLPGAAKSADMTDRQSGNSHDNAVETPDGPDQPA